MAISALLDRMACRSVATSLTRTVCYVFLLLSAASYVSSYNLEVDIQGRDSSLFQLLEQTGQIHIDESPRPETPRPGLVARNILSESSLNTIAPSSTATAPSESSASAVVTTTMPSSMSNGTASTPSSSSNTASSSTSAAPTVLPSPFDTSLGVNFTTASCPTFFTTFLANSTFKSCLPVSLLLQNSMGFFRAFRYPMFLDTILDTSCAAPLAICSPLMSSIANNLIDDANCGQDYQRQNPIVMQAYSGLVAYEPLYNATCLPNQATGNYCFTDAVTNASNPADLYPYYTAIGIALPVSAQPTCSPCLQETMNIFAGYARQKSQPLAHTYVGCATQVDGACGLAFADTQIKVAVVSSAVRRSQIATLGIAAAIFALSLLLFA